MSWKWFRVWGKGVSQRETTLTWIVFFFFISTSVTSLLYLKARSKIATHDLEVKNLRFDFDSQKLKLEEAINNLTEEKATLQTERDSLEAELARQKKINDSFTDQISEITSTVGSLTKLSETDPELLKKYSKVYFLNENYTPSSLKAIPNTFVYDESREQQVLAEVYPFLSELLTEAADDGVQLEIVSAYRSFNEQASLKGRYSVIYGATSANQFSADQGYSEHQLGTAVDFTAPGVSPTTTAFAQTEAFSWLQDHAYRYGFVLSYPEDNTYYVYEPWHWRFVGTELARDLNKANAHFYDWDQRTIDSYLINLFD